MARHKLPPIFSAVRMHLPKEHMPSLVLHYPDVSAMLLGADLEAIQKVHGTLPLVFLSPCWIEMGPGDLGGMVRCFDPVHGTAQARRTSIDGLAADLQLRCTLWPGKRVRPDRNLTFAVRMSSLEQDLNKVPAPARAGAAMFVGDYMRIAAELWQRLETDTPTRLPVVTGERLAPRAYERAGDTIRYIDAGDLHSQAGLASLRTYTPPEDPSGIRKRDHQVRGHWRTYKSGARVWVRNHRRGDPDLGTVTRIVTAQPSQKGMCHV